MLKKGLIPLSILAAMALGGAATVTFVSSRGTVEAGLRNMGAAFVALVVVAMLTTVNLGVRWLRWHSLARRVAVRLPTRDSVRLYLVTLPAIATPFYLGELVRPALLRRRFPGAGAGLVSVWLLERTADATAILVWLLVARGEWGWVGVLLVAWPALSYALVCAYRRVRRTGLAARSTLVILIGTSLAAWALPILALHAVLRLVDAGTTLSMAGEVFAKSTLIGGLTGIPLGTAVTGGTAIGELEAAGVRSDIASLAVVVFRGGTTWYGLTFGVLAFARWWKSVWSFGRGPSAESHFDAIADEYRDQIPEYLRRRLLVRKAQVMHEHLGSPGRGLRGLELGCGHGWYADEMARLGYEVTAFDLSAAQLMHARAHVADVGVQLGVADASHLPFVSGAFDFAYAINVVHHIHDHEARLRSLREIVRVLKPGGTFFLHEINTENPLFRFYVGYVCPLLRDIDEGNEAWIKFDALPVVPGAQWQGDVDYFTFLPDFTPSGLAGRLEGTERWLERSRLRHWSAHYVARLVKADAVVEANGEVIPATQRRSGGQRRLNRRVGGDR